MKITVVEMGGKKHEIECESFEFRSNTVTNWIRVKYKDHSDEIWDVATIKSMEE